MGHWVNADGPAAIAILQALPSQGLDTTRRAARDCMLARFSHAAEGRAGEEPALSDAPPLPPAVAAILQAYRRYWTTVLMQRTPAAQAEAGLSAALRAAGVPARHDLAAQTEAALDLVRGHGLHALAGVTPPLHEFMLWRHQATAVEAAVLPEGVVEVPVTRLEGFVSLGWLAHATCGHHHTGGWATDEGLMVVSAAWDFSSEAYRVSLLAHEAQHFADRCHHPELDAADLEYRAKLTEIAVAEDNPHDLLKAFAAQARPGRARPHAHASHWLLVRLREHLGGVDPATAAPAALRAAARAERVAHDQALEAGGGRDARTALPD